VGYLAAGITSSIIPQANRSCLNPRLTHAAPIVQFIVLVSLNSSETLY
jgi:hypothetical protein